MKMEKKNTYKNKLLKNGECKKNIIYISKVSKYKYIYI